MRSAVMVRPRLGGSGFGEARQEARGRESARRSAASNMPGFPLLVFCLVFCGRAHRHRVAARSRLARPSVRVSGTFRGLSLVSEGLSLRLGLGLGSSQPLSPRPASSGSAMSRAHVVATLRAAAGRPPWSSRRSGRADGHADRRRARCTRRRRPGFCRFRASPHARSPHPSHVRDPRGGSSRSKAVARRSTTMRTVIGLFGNAGEARRAIDELQGLGYAPEKISLVTNVASQEALRPSKSSLAFESLELKDVGKIVTGGPLREVLARQPGLVGGLGPALQLFGLTPELAEHYASGVRHGETLESLTVDDKDSDRVLAVMRRRTLCPAPDPEETEAPLEEPRRAAGAGAIGAAGAGGIGGARTDASEGTKAATPSEPLDAGTRAAAPKEKKTNGHFELDDREEERVIPIVREEIRVGRRTVERGGVRVSTRIVERPVSEQVHLRETHVDIERRAVDRPIRGDEKAFADVAIEMVEMADEPVVSKQSRVVEEVVVRRHVEDHAA